MTDSRAATAEPDVTKGAWSDVFRNGLGLYSALVIGGIAMHATQMLVIAIIMPTIVADIGGADYYTWAAMLYTIGAIVGASSSGMALITALYDARLRTRIIALSQGTFTACHLSGPVVGGIFAAMNWWRGSFWAMVPLMLGFAVLAYCKIPDRLAGDAEPGRAASVPLLRLATLTAGVFCLAGAGPVQNTALRILLIAAAVALVGLTFRLDRGARTNLFPPRALSLGAPIGLALWIL